jgi:type IV secretion system protein VirB9
MKKFILAVFFISYAGFLYAAQEPISTSQDPRIKRINYQSSNIVHLHGHPGYSVHVVFSPAEEVVNVAIGDASAWEVVSVKNNIFLKPVVDSNTNMTVLTNQRAYHFNLISADNVKDLTYQLQFVYPEQVITNDEDYKKDLNSMDLNWEYSFAPRNAEAIAPIQAFDDGQFTYFKFHRNQPIPAIFTVDDRRNESVVNYHVEDGRVVVNQVAEQFTFRYNGEAVSVFNDTLIDDEE